MAHKRLTERFPFLLPIRRWQRKRMFYLKMRLDENRYSKERQEELLPYPVFESRSLLINENSGYSLQYQHNKIHNLQLAVQTVDRLLIRPGETFSFWQLVRHADRKEGYRDGLSLTNGKIVPEKGGGLCQLSNLLFWLFLHTPMEIAERHPHAVEAFPVPRSEVPDGADATVNEGWKDLKVKNNGSSTFQLSFSFEDGYLLGRIYADRAPQSRYEIFTKDMYYYRQPDGRIFQQAAVWRRELSLASGETRREGMLYQNLCEIGYSLPPETIIFQKESERP